MLGFYQHRAWYAAAVTAPYVDPPDPDGKGDVPRDRRRLAVLWRLTVLMRPYRMRFAVAVVMLVAAAGLAPVYPPPAR